MQKSTSYKFQVFSYLFTLAMVLYHAQWDYLSDTTIVMRVYSSASNVLENLGEIAMAYFFMTSGFMLYYNANNTNIKEKVLRRIKTLLIPFFVWNMIYMPLKMIVLHESAGGLPNILYHFSFAPYAGPLWYVFAVFILSLFSPLIVQCMTISKNSIKFIIVILCIVSLLIYGLGILSVFGLSEETHFVMWSVRLWRYIPAYLLGCYVGLFRKSAFVELGITKQIIVAIVIILMLVLWIVTKMPSCMKQVFITLEPVLLWALFNDSLFKKKERKYKYIKNTFLMYATHFLIIYVVRVAVMYIIVAPIDDISALIVWIITPLIIVVATIVFSNLLVLLLKKSKQEKVLFLLTGGRY